MNDFIIPYLKEFVLIYSLVSGISGLFLTNILYHAAYHNPFQQFTGYIKGAQPIFNCCECACGCVRSTNSHKPNYDLCTYITFALH